MTFRKKFVQASSKILQQSYNLKFCSRATIHRIIMCSHPAGNLGMAGGGGGQHTIMNLLIALTIKGGGENYIKIM
jgi:hypothetical protein